MTILYCDATECLLSCHCYLVRSFCNRCNLFTQFKIRLWGSVTISAYTTASPTGRSCGRRSHRNGIPPHLPLWVQVPPARNTLHRGGSEEHHAEAKAIKPPGSNWTPKSPPHTHRRLIADAIYRYRYCAGLEPASRHRGENRRLPSLSQQALGVPNWRQ